MATIDELLQQAATVNGYGVASSLGTDSGMYSANEAEFDLRTMTPNMLRQKYGPAAASHMQGNLQRGISDRQGDMSIRDNRSAGEAAFDSTTGALAGFVGGIGGLAALGTGLVHEGAGTWLGDKVQSGMAWTEEQQSESVNAARRLQRAVSGVDARDNIAKMDQEIAEGDSEFVAGLRRWGRDTVDTLGNSVTDPTMLGQGTSEAVGSLLAGGPISKGLKAIGAPLMNLARGSGLLARTAAASADDTAAVLASLRQGDSLIGAVGTGRIARAGEFAAWPTAIAGLESGGAYSGTVSEIMGMTPEQLQATSPTYRELTAGGMSHEDAQRRVANNAALMAAAIQAPIAGAAGLLTRFAETPFRVPSLGSAARNVLLNEPLEEAVQSTTGGLAQNYAVQQYADDTRQLTEGLGEQTAQGALYGLTAAGAVQAPGAAVQAPLAAGRVAYSAVKRGASALNNVVSKHYEQQTEQLSKASPLSEETVQSAVEEARPQVLAMVPALQGIIDASTAEPDQKARESAFVQSLGQAWDLTSEEVVGMPPEVRNAPNRFVAVHQMSRRIAQLPEGSRDQLAAIAARESLLEPINNLQSPDLQILGELEDGQTKRQLDFVRNVLANSVVTPADRRADAVIDSLTQEGKTPILVEELSDAAIETPEGQLSGQAAAALMTARPGTGSLEVANLLLKHARSGKLNLTPAQRRAVEASHALLQAADMLTQGKANGALKPADIVNGQVLNDRRDPLNKDPRFKQSARQHISNVLGAIRSGNTPEASALMQDFGLFVQHMQNKLDAHNRHYGLGNPSGKKIGFQALDPDATNRVWYDSAPSVFVNTKSEDSIRHAQTVALEANTLADLYNNLVDALPELNLSNQKVEKILLDPALEGTPSEVVQRHEAMPVQTQRQETSRGQEVNAEEVQSTGTTEGEAERVDSGTEVQSEESGARAELTPVSRVTQEQAQALSDEGLNKRIEAIQEKRSKKTNTPEDDATFKVLDEEMTRREDEAVRQQQQESNLEQLADKARPSVTGEFADADQVMASIANDGEVLLIHTRNGDQDTITAMLDGEQVGSLTYEPSTDVALDTQVEPEARKLGIARAMYRFAAEKGNFLLGREAKNGIAHSFTPEGRAMRARMDITKSTLSEVEEQVDTQLTPEQQALVDQANALMQEPAKQTTATMYPDLMNTGDHSLHEALLPNSENESRLVGQEVPADFVVNALESQASLEAVIGETTSNLTEDISRAYSTVLSEGSNKNRKNLGGVLNTMRANLEKFLNTKNYRELMQNGTAFRWQRGKALNILNSEGVYDESLLQAAAMAGIQWVLTSRSAKVVYEDSDYMAMTGAPDASWIQPWQKDILDNSMSVDQVKNAIAKKIMEFWGLRSNPNMDNAYAEGIAEAVAAEVMTALIDVDFMDMTPLQFDFATSVDEDGEAVLKTLNRYSIPASSYPEILRAFPNAIERVVLVSPEPTRFLNGDVAPVPKTQMNTPSVNNTADQRKAIEAANKIEYRVNSPVLRAFQALGAEGLVTLFSGRKAHWTKMNERHQKAQEGRERSITEAYADIEETIAQLENQGTTVEDGVIRYAHNMSKVGRLQQLGAYNPQANKTTREVFLPTWSTLDLVNNTDHINAFFLAIAQHLEVKDGNDLKVNKMPMSESVKLARNALDTTFAPLVQYLRDWSKNVDDGAKLDATKIQELLNGREISQAAFHSLVEYSRLMEATPEERSNFRTAMYLEADGVTNGPIMAMMMLTLGKFAPNWLRNVAKGGVTFGFKKTMAQGDEAAKVDLYKTATIHMEAARKMLLDKINQQKNRHFVNQNMTALSVVMDALFGKDVSYDPTTGTLTFERGIAKNPLTITLYGSSAMGIAGNFANQVLDALSVWDTEVQSQMENDPSLTEADVMFDGDQNKWNTFNNALNHLRDNVLSYSMEKDQLNVFQSEYDGKDAEFKALRDNFLYGFVEPMVTGIERTVGPQLVKTMTQMRKATQVQSIFLEHAFREEVQKVLDQKRKDDPTRAKTDFLSDRDFAAIDKAMAERFPNIKTKTQEFRIAKSQRNFDENVDYSRGLDEGHRTMANVYAPADAGVSGIASLVIGFGDGYMIQVAVQDPAMDKILAVFDGINMPLDNLATTGEVANRAAYEAFMQNPLLPVWQSYKEFHAQTDMENLPEEMLKQLAHAFQNPKEPRLTAEEIAPLLPSLMEELENNLAWSAKSVEARHRALQEVPMSVDHMASASAAFVNGVQAHQMSENDVLAFLNERYQHYMDTLEFKTSFTAKRVAETQTEESAGVVIHSADNLASLVQEMNLTEDQKAIVDQIMSSLKAADYSVVSGSLKDIIDYRVSRNLPVDQLSENDNGFMSIGEKKIYLINPTGETLTHELVHAATMETLLAYYAGNIKDPGVKKAVENLEAMMFEFVSQPTDQSLPFEMFNAIEDAKNAIEQFTNMENLDPNVAMAGALNEFMAWSLSNQQLMDRLKEQKIPRAQKWTKKDLRLLKWAKDVIASIQTILWSGKKYARATANALANLQFNTAVLLNTQPSLVEAFEEVTLYHTTATRPLLDDVRTAFRNKILAVANQVAPVDRKAYEVTHKQYLIETEELSKLLSRAFRLSTVEESTLVSIVAAMGTEMQLDPNVLQRMQTMWTHVQKNLKVEDLKDPNAADQQADDHWANEKFNLLMGKTNRLVDPSGRTSLLPVFIGMSLVSDEFRTLLAKIEPPRSMKGDGTFDSGVRQFANGVMDALSARMTGERNSLSVRQAMDAMMERLYHNILNEQSNLDAIETMIDRPSLSLNDRVVNLLSAASDKGFEMGKKLQAPTNNSVTKAAGRVLQLTAGIASEKNGDAVAEGVLSTAERTDLNNGLMNLLKDFIGRTEATKDVYDLIKPIRAMVQQIRQQFRESVPQVITEAFKNAPTKEQYATMFRAMAKTDLPSLVGTMSKADALRLFTDPSFLDQQILDLETQLRTMDRRHFSVLKDKMQQLSKFMNTGVRGNNLLRNAHAVARLWNENTAQNRPAVSAEMQNIVDQLISLYAVEGLSKADRDGMASLVRSERNGLNFVLSYLEGQRRTEIRKARQGMAVENHYKGYIYSLPQKTGHIVVADDTEYTSMIQQGYSRVKDYTGSDILNVGVRRGYYYTDLPARASFAQGMIQNVDQTAYGVDPVTGFSRDLVAGRIVSRRLVKQLEAQMKREKTLTENLSPIYNDRGDVIAFEQTMDVRELARMEPSDQLHEMLGVWRGRQVEERISQQMNKVLFDQLHVDWQRDKNHTPELYVNLFDSKTLDAVQRDAVSLFSDESKAYIEQKFGKGVFMVRKSLLDDVTGYRQPSISDFWTNINRNKEGTNEAIRKALLTMFGPKVYRYLVQAEQIIQGLVSDARTTIVVRSVLIPAINIVSNIYQLIQRGVNPIQIGRETAGIVNQLNGYIESRLEQIRLEAQLRASTDDVQQTARLRAKIRSITDSHKRLAIWPLIEAGEFSTIADVGMSRDDLQLSSGRIHEWIEQQLNKLPPGLQTAAKYGMVSRDTALFQGLQKSVQFGDFVAKAILYNHLTQKKRMSKKEALGIITEEFVNYDRLPGRIRGGLENIGVLWFFNFKLRSVKVALSTIRNNPLHAMFGMLLPTPSGIGTPIDENVIAKTMEGNLGYSIGPGMGMRAPFLNPWYQLVN